MQFRIAEIKDIAQIQFVRQAVKENVLSNPSLVTDDDCKEFLFVRGKGWVCEVQNKIVGFAIADLKEDKIWALFILPEYEGKGIGKQLHKMMLDWYFNQNKNSVWLGTAPGTRAQSFYRKAGWKETGMLPNGEIRFELKAEEWKSYRRCSCHR